MLAFWPFFLLQLALAFPQKRGSDPREQYLVSSLPGLYENIDKSEIPLMFAGQLELYPENDTHYFFWKYSDHNKIPENDKRTMFWLNGGPGCSSMDGALLEAGPFRVNKDEKIVYNSGSWHKASDIVFVDQPSGTGFSYGEEYSHNLDHIGFTFVKFLEKYFEVFPEDLHNDIYIAGESYAGQYIPYVAKHILERNKRVGDKEPQYNLKSLMIGNGFVSPNEQGMSYFPFLYQAGVLEESNPQWGTLLAQQEKCQKIVDHIDANWDDDVPNNYETNNIVCERILSMALDATLSADGPSNEMCYNMYDYTKKDSYPACGSNWPFELQYVTPFLRQKAVMTQLNLIKQKEWRECTGRVSKELRERESIPSVHLLPKLLEEVPIMFFNGNLDIICNYLGTEAFIKKLKWGGERGFKSDAADWVYDGEVAGYIKSERNLTFVNVFNSSHMVPYDLPEISRALIDLATGNYDIKEQNDKQKKAYVTYPLGERNKKPQAPEQPTTANTISKPTPVEEEPQVSALPSATTGPVEPSASAKPVPGSPEATSNAITRLIQLFVICILIWGIYVLYASYRSRPSSIIKTGPSGRKKNVQWADQLRRFQEDDEEFQQQKSQGFLSKTISKWKGTDAQGKYAPPGQYAENIELGEAVVREDRDVADFVIDSDDEQGHPQPSHQV